MREGEPSRGIELDGCARCHARRSPLREPYARGRPFLDSYRPALLDPGLYFADGQIQDEVYVWGSFVQSRMHAAGVGCSDCHDPHSLEVRGGPDDVCASCHAPATFATTAHHGHEPTSAGASCVACHMPARTYMVVDPRRDHSIRVPRPDLSVELGTPNACNGCHDDQDARWAADLVAEWFPEGRTGTPHWGQVFHAAREGRPEAILRDERVREVYLGHDFRL